jgi:hypothetical protein
VADINIRIPDCDDDDGGERGERGKRGHRGHDGATGPTGPGGTGPTGPAGPIGLPTFAAALVDGVTASPTEGFLSNSGFSSYFRLGIGQYRLGFAGSPPPDVNCIINVTSATVFAVSVSESGFMSGGFVIVTFEQGNTPIDAVFNITVTDNR